LRNEDRKEGRKKKEKMGKEKEKYGVLEKGEN
jgi:hypothetical protein